MTNEERTKLADVFRAVFELDAGADVTEVRRDSHPKWDSLGHVTLVAAIESEFDLELDTGDALALDSFATAEQMLGARAVG